MTLNSNAKFEEKLTCGLENDMSEIWKIFIRALKSLKIRTLMEPFCPTQKMYELKIYRLLMSHD